MEKFEYRVVEFNKKCFTKINHAINTNSFKKLKKLFWC